jgi:surface carbohydrate biosynthesis protein
MAVSGREYRWLILPIETKVRELDGKLLLAATAAERGWAVILGQVERIVGNTLHLPGVVLEKDGYFGNPRIGPFLASGKRVCALDEEGLVYLNSDDYCRRRLDRQNLHRLDRVFVWGQQQSHDILEHVSGLEDKLVLSGNPRFDLLRPELRAYYAPAAAQLNDHFGQFVLVNTNFADCNHFMGADWVIANLRNNRFITNAEQEANERAFMKYQRQILDHFVTLVRTLATSFPEHTIVVRPHPSEDHGTWREATSSLNNVTVIHEGDVNSWLLAAAVSIRTVRLFPAERRQQQSRDNRRDRYHR